VSKVLLLTSTRESAAEILPSLSLLNHTVAVAAATPEAVSARPAGRGGQFGAAGSAGQAEPFVPDVVLVDARHHLVMAKGLLGQLAGAGVPLLAVISEGAWAAITAEWGADDVVLHTAGPGEVEARIRLATGRAAAGPAVTQAAEVRSGELVIDEATYSAKIRGVTLDLTFKEFELLKFLAQHPRRVFTRSQLLQEVWGYDYFGGTRTVDVHVRRLRAKLGSENEALIGTVRNVGYKFVPAKAEGRRGPAAAPGPQASLPQASPPQAAPVSPAPKGNGTRQVRSGPAQANAPDVARAAEGDLA
jgi:DNA-binding response OmpR family regulator